MRPRSRTPRLLKRGAWDVPMTVDAIALQSLDVEDLKNRIFLQFVAIIVVKSAYCTACEFLHWGVYKRVCVCV